MKTNAVEILKNRYKRGKPKGRLIAHKDSVEYHQYNERYDTYVNWDFLSYTTFLTTPIGEWLFKPRGIWGEYARGFFWLWFGCRWSKTYRYVEKAEWVQAQIQKKVDMITNMQIDSLKMSQKGPPGGYD